jgi:hypothetical protein
MPPTEKKKKRVKMDGGNGDEEDMGCMATVQYYNIYTKSADSTYTGNKDSISISIDMGEDLDLPQPMTDMVRSVDPTEP